MREIYIVEVENNSKKNIVGIYNDESEFNQFKKEYPELNNNKLSVIKISFTQFPFFIVEKLCAKVDNNENNYLYKDYEGVDHLIKKIKRDDTKEVYYKCYFIREPMFINDINYNCLDYLYQVEINNRFLDVYNFNDPKSSMNESLLSSMAYNFDIYSMERNYNEFKAGVSTFSKQNLLEAYISMLGQMQYDFACGKLNNQGLSALLPTIKIIEDLEEKPFYGFRAQIYMILMEVSEKDNFTEAKNYCLKAIASLEEDFKVNKEDFQDGCNYMAECFLFLSKEANKSHYWIEALKWIKKSLEADPLNGNWFLYFKMIYLPEDEFVKFKDLQNKEIEESKSYVKQLANKPILYTIIATQFKRLLEVSKNYNFDEEYFFFLNKSLEIPIKESMHILRLSDIGHFYHNEGVRLQRIDLLEKALEYHEFINKNEDLNALSVYYLAKDYIEISNIYFNKKDHEASDNYLQTAADCFEVNYNVIKTKYSPLLHYFEFLVNSKLTNKNITLPTTQKIKSIGNKLITMGEGFYSDPYFLMAKIALNENNEELATAFITRSLILHELCIDKEILEFKNKYSNLKFEKLNKFLDKTIDFIQRVRKNYYYAPEIKWIELKEMNNNEVLSQWELVKARIEERD